MSWQLTHAVLNHTPAQIGGTERLILIVLAEKIHLRAGEYDPAATYVTELDADAMLHRTGLDTESALRKALRRLADHGIDVRVALGEDKHGKPVYAYRGQVPRYRLVMPKLAAPAGCSCDLCRPDRPQQTTAPPADPATAAGSPDLPPSMEGGPPGPPSGLEGGPVGPPLPEKGGPVGPPSAQEGGDLGPQGGPVGPPLRAEGGPTGPPFTVFGSRSSSSRSPNARLAAEIRKLTDADEDEAVRLAATLATAAALTGHPIHHPRAYARRMALAGDLALALAEQRATDATRAAPRPRQPALEPHTPSADIHAAAAAARELFAATAAAAQDAARRRAERIDPPPAGTASAS